MFKTVLKKVQETILPQFSVSVDAWITELIKIWDEQTLKDILNGKVVISEKVINDYLAKHSLDNDVQELCVYAKADNVVEIHLLSKKWGIIRLVCLILEVKHDTLQSTLTFQLLRKEFVGKRFMSWLFSLLRISWFTKLFGRIEFGEGITVVFNSDCMKIDFKERLNIMKLAKIQVQGTSLLNVIRVTGAKATEGQVILDVSLAM